MDRLPDKSYTTTLEDIVTIRKFIAADLGHDNFTMKRSQPLRYKDDKGREVNDYDVDVWLDDVKPESKS